MFQKHYRLGFDPYLLLIPLALCLIGLLVLYSASQNLMESRGINYVLRQSIWFGVGILFIMIIARIDYRRFLDLSYVLYGVTLMLLIFALVFSDARMGARRWVSVAGIAFQPSEFAKISFILVLAYYLGNNRHALRGVGSCAIPFLLLAVPFILIAKEPDLGSALVFVPILLMMLYAAGLPMRSLLSIMAAGSLATPLLWHFLKDYQRERLLVFINPNADPLGAGYTIIQSKIAIGSGGLWGKGWMSGTQSQLNFLPEHHTDFIFSIIGEEWGFAGSALVMVLFLIFFRHALVAAHRTRDIYGRLIITGATAVLAFQAIVNICMTAGLMPVVGLTLPFISAGGSSLLTTCICVGLIVSVDAHRTTF